MDPQAESKEEKKARQMASKGMTDEEKKAQREKAKAEKLAKKNKGKQATGEEEQKVEQSQNNTNKNEQPKGPQKNNQQDQAANGAAKGAKDSNPKKGQEPSRPTQDPTTSDQKAKIATTPGFVSKIFPKMDSKVARKPLAQQIQEAQEKKPLHPRIMELALDLTNVKFLSSNQQCVATLRALAAFLKDWQPTAGSKLFVSAELNEAWSDVTSFIKGCCQLHSGLDNALDYILKCVVSLRISGADMSLQEMKDRLLGQIDTYIEERVIKAQEVMVSHAHSLFSKDKQETIMVIGTNYAFDLLFQKQMQEHGGNFRVIVVDTCPIFPNRDLCQRLSSYGVPCQYTLITGVSCLLPQTTKVFIAASYVLGNGGIVAPVGCSMVAYLASQYRVPVIAFCETYKFTQRANLDQIKNNECGDPRMITHNDLLSGSDTEKDKMLQQKNLYVRYLKYDFTAMSSISLILCEMGRVSPVSVPVIVDELNADQEFEDEDE